MQINQVFLLAFTEITAAIISAILATRKDKEKACFDEEWQKRVETNFGKPEITYFDNLIEIDNVLNTVKVSDE